MHKTKINTKCYFFVRKNNKTKTNNLNDCCCQPKEKEPERKGVKEKRLNQDESWRLIIYQELYVSESFDWIVIKLETWRQIKYWVNRFRISRQILHYFTFNPGQCLKGGDFHKRKERGRFFLSVFFFCCYCFLDWLLTFPIFFLLSTFLSLFCCSFFLLKFLLSLKLKFI